MEKIQFLKSSNSFSWHNFTTWKWGHLKLLFFIISTTKSLFTSVSHFNIFTPRKKNKKKKLKFMFFHENLRVAFTIFAFICEKNCKHFCEILSSICELFIFCQRWLVTTGAIYSLKRYSTNQHFFFTANFRGNFQRHAIFMILIFLCALLPLFLARGTFLHNQFLLSCNLSRLSCDDVVHRRLLCVAL